MRDARIGAPEKYGDGAVLLLIFCCPIMPSDGFQTAFLL